MKPQNKIFNGSNIVSIDSKCYFEYKDIIFDVKTMNI